MTKSDKLLATMLVICLLIFGYSMGKAFNNNSPDPVQITPIQTQSPAPALTMPSGGDDEDGEEEDDD